MEKQRGRTQADPGAGGRAVEPAEKVKILKKYSIASGNRFAAVEVDGERVDVVIRPKGEVTELGTVSIKEKAVEMIRERRQKSEAGGGVPADIRGEGEAGEQEVPAGVEGEASKKIHLSRKTRRGLALVRMIVMAAFDPSMPTAQTMVDRLKKRDVNEFNQALAWMEQNEDWEAVADRMERMKTGK